MIGIYEIRNKKNEKVYIGQSVNTDARFARHIRDLKRETHYNIHLQRSFNKHGENQFELLVLEECKESQLTEKEQKWIDKHPGNLCIINSLRSVICKEKEIHSLARNIQMNPKRRCPNGKRKITQAKVIQIMATNNLKRLVLKWFKIIQEPN